MRWQRNMFQIKNRNKLCDMEIRQSTHERVQKNFKNNTRTKEKNESTQREVTRSL